MFRSSCTCICFRPFWCFVDANAIFYRWLMCMLCHGAGCQLVLCCWVLWFWIWNTAAFHFNYTKPTTHNIPNVRGWVLQPAVVEHTWWWLKQQIINMLRIVYSCRNCADRITCILAYNTSWSQQNIYPMSHNFLKHLYNCTGIWMPAHTAHTGFMFLWLLSQSMVSSN